ncbi:hypothetical protein AVEN_232166-1 [Araneus ventricosus]|uniref:Uncharacterized protein n=1 Tax=Araneus ventricosus TaxID=182803 RepID=A0A4Y2N2J7_ARAVE|nr:hypothetical protein AVEN_232166-1 [Araneus ventricosus]
MLTFRSILFGRTINGRGVYDRATELSPSYISQVQKTRSGFISICFYFTFQDLKTYDSVTMESFKEVCRARNLLEDDGEWRDCLREASNFQMPAKLRQLFSFICVFCNPMSPLELWEEFKTYLWEDFLIHTSVQQC